MLLLLYEVLLAQFPLGLLGVGQLVVPFRGVLPTQVLCSHFVEGLELLVLELDGVGQVPLSGLLDAVLVGLDQVQFLEWGGVGEGGEMR